ncbi:histidine kinase, partial [Streptomyces sp. URMC 129]
PAVPSAAEPRTAESPPGPPTPAGTAPQGGRPSWAAGDDSGPIPIARDEQDAPRGHDEPESTGEYARPGYPGATGTGPAAVAAAFGHRPPRPQPPADATSFNFPSAPSRRPASPRDTGEVPAAQQPPASAVPRPEAPRPPAPRPAGPEPEPDEARAAEPRPAGAEPSAPPEPQPQAPAEPEPLVPARKPDELRDPLPASFADRAPERTPIFEEMESTWFGTRRAAVPPEDSADAPGATPAPGPRPAAAAPSAAQRPTVRGEPAPGEAGAPWRPSPNDERWRQAEQLRQPSAGGVTTSGLPRRVPRANLVAGAAQSQEATPAGPLVSRRPDDVRGRLTNLRRGIQQGRQAGSSADRTERDLGPTYQQ